MNEFEEANKRLRATVRHLSRRVERQAAEIERLQLGDPETPLFRAELEKARAEIERLRYSATIIGAEYRALFDRAVVQRNRAAKAEAAVARVRRRHWLAEGGYDAGFCAECDERWPCSTVRALDGGE